MFLDISPAETYYFSCIFGNRARGAQRPREAKTKKRRPKAAFAKAEKCGLMFRELETCASGALTVFFTLFGARVARQETCVFEGRTQIGIVVDEGAGDGMKHRAGLTRFPAAADIDFDVEVFGEIDEFQRLTQNHAKRCAIEIIFNTLFVDGNGALAGTEINARYGAFATACS